MDADEHLLTVGGLLLLADRFGRRRVQVVGLLQMFVSSILSSTPST